MWIASSTALVGFIAFQALVQAQGLQVKSMTWSGRGCPSGSVSFTPDRAGTDLILLFSAFTMELPDAGTKNCAIHIDLGGIPAGQQVVFNNATARGFLALDKESTASYRATGFWSSDANSTVSTTFCHASSFLPLHVLAPHVAKTRKCVYRPNWGGRLGKSKDDGVNPRTTFQFTITKEYNGDTTDNAFQLGPLELSQSDKKKYGSPCEAAKTIFNFNLAVTLSGSGDAIAQVDNLDLNVGLMPC